MLYDNPLLEGESTNDFISKNAAFHKEKAVIYNQLTCVSDFFHHTYFDSEALGTTKHHGGAKIRTLYVDSSCEGIPSFHVTNEFFIHSLELPRPVTHTISISTH